MKVIFMGTPEFSVGTLEALIRVGHQVVLAVTQPDRAKGRGGKVQESPVKEAAKRHGIPVFQPERIRKPEAVEELRKYQADVMVVIAFGQILPGEVLEMTPYGCINVHASLLPDYRGAAPIQWAILDGRKVSGVTTMQMDEGLDTGDMLLKEEVVLDKKETGGSLHDKMAQIGADLCVRTLEALETGQLEGEKQPKESPTDYARMLDKAMGEVDWSQTARAIEQKIRGLNPWPAAWTMWKGKLLKIWEGEVLSSKDLLREEDPSAHLPGEVVTAGKDGLVVQTGEGRILIRELQLAGKRRMATEEFLRGVTLQEGEILGEKEAER